MNKKKNKKIVKSTQPAAPTSEIQSEEALIKIFSLLREQTHIDFSNYKITTVSRRIHRQMRLNKIENMDKYADFLTAKPDAVKVLCDDIFIHVTDFFRDAESFQALGELVFPRIVKNKTLGTPIRIWIPGCSTGEEAYSLAFSLLEFLGDKVNDIPLQIFATDISEEVIQKARVGFFTKEQVKNISPTRLQRFFEKSANGYKVKKSIRDHCIFSRHDVTSNPPFAKIDLVSCRNVLIYFSPLLQKQVMPIFHYSLNPDGFLWLGKSEAPNTFSKLFSLIDKTHKIYSKINTATPMNFRFPTSQSIKERTESIKKTPFRSSVELDCHKEVDRIVLSRYTPAGVVVSNDMEIIQIRGKISSYLELPSGQPNYNLLKMVRPELLQGIRMAFQAVQKNNMPIRKEGLAYGLGSERKKINIEIIPVNPLSSLKERQFLILFEPNVAETSSSANKKRTLTESTSKTKTNGNYVAQLLEELDSMRDYQQSLAEGYEATQEELTSANEELQSTVEEFLSTNEELETAKEELQAANEELTTVNDELQHRNTELGTANEKLAQSEERFRLIIENVKDYAIFMLNPDGTIATWNEGARRFKGYEASEIIGKHFSKFYNAEDIAANKPERELEIARTEGRYEEEGYRVRKDGTTFWASVVITAIRDKESNLRGFAKVTRDMSERKNADEKLKASEERFRLMIQGIRDYAIYMLDPEGKIQTWNEGAKHLKGYESKEILGKHFSVFYPDSEIMKGKPALELKLAAEKGQFEDEGWRIRKDGSKFWANVIVTAIHNVDGSLRGFAKITRDLTERKVAEEKMHFANEELEKRVQVRTAELREALSARDEFLSIASHELKTPLTSLQLQLEITKRAIDTKQHMPSPEDLTEAFDLALRQISSLDNLIEGLLDISRIQTGHLTLNVEEINLSSLVHEIVNRLAVQLKLAQCPIQLTLEKNIVGRWEKQRLEQIIVNLLSNAIKYAPRQPIHISLKNKEGRVILVVEDFGPGITPENQAKIFNRFERANQSRNAGGLGLGLFIVKKIVEAHGGTIQVQSVMGEGSKFIVDLPQEASIAVLENGSNSIKPS